ncbi:iron complex transport system substrate-binding protein [Pseudonocardia hierapolitana]|uniref:Iron complex transport system substrate-binding protein n=1 Tax=Pseudonocardia hierapolitana TaxID=1128676 RepID=A0A561SQL8_9PSEU|nr:ABC transporter substrate-binding protein [Pseudonocardia hierapolitana]TWF77141.1 iron complex transport system substrate-binding protein [Pseudonocardia hierapolitana]
MELELSRRTVLRLGFVTLTGLAAGCAGSTPDTAGNAPTASAEPGALPVTLDHAYGSTTVAVPPGRVAVVGLGDADVLLALGVVPVLVPVWNGSVDDGVGTWARPHLGGAAPVPLANATTDFDLEPIAAADPDLIVAVNNAIEEDVYRRLSAIAPTVLHAPGQTDWALPWKDVTTRIGAAVGLPGRAAAEVGEVEELFARTRAENPRFAERTAALVRVLDGGVLRVFSPGSGRGQLLTEMGFQPVAGVRDAFGDAFYVDVSPENTALVDGDLLVVDNHEAAKPRLDALPTFAALPVVRDGRMIGLDPVASDAVSMPNSLTIPFVIGELLERIRQVPLR